jgi:uncharacterized membrane protein
MSMKQIERLRNSHMQQRERINQIVRESLREEKFLAEKLLDTGEETITKGQNLADKIANFGGSWKFIFTFLLIILVWILFNVWAVAYRFDPFPFILMNLFLSCLAALQAPIIMMTQNRKEEKDRRRAENDYMINLKAEMEIRSLHQKVDLLLGDCMKSLYDSQANQLSLLKDIEQKLDDSPTSQDNT